MKLVAGVGINDVDFKVTIAGKEIRSYSLWKSMLQRCYDTKFQNANPAYVGCTVSELFKRFSYFDNWCTNQVGYINRGWQLDKDILSGWGKIYSETVCAFVPHEVNSFFNARGNCRGKFPRGVSLRAGGKFVAQYSFGGKVRYLGSFNSYEDAAIIYNSTKEHMCKVLATKWRGMIDDRVYNTMMSWKVPDEDFENPPF